MGWWLANISFQVVCLLCWYSNHRILPGAIKLTAAMVFVTMVIETIAAYYWLVMNQNNLFLFHLLVPTQYIFLALTFSRQFSARAARVAIIWSIPLVVGTGIVFALTIQPLTVYNTYTQLLAYLLLTILTAYYIWEQLNSHTENPILPDPFFWISLGILFYGVTSFIIAGTLNYLIANSFQWAGILYDFLTIIAFIMYAFFAFAYFVPKIFDKQVSTHISTWHQQR